MENEFTEKLKSKDSRNFIKEVNKNMSKQFKQWKLRNIVRHSHGLQSSIKNPIFYQNPAIPTAGPKTPETGSNGGTRPSSHYKTKKKHKVVRKGALSSSIWRTNLTNPRTSKKGPGPHIRAQFSSLSVFKNPKNQSSSPAGSPGRRKRFNQFSSQNDTNKDYSTSQKFELLKMNSVLDVKAALGEWAHQQERTNPKIKTAEKNSSVRIRKKSKYLTQGLHAKLKMSRKNTLLKTGGGTSNSKSKLHTESELSNFSEREQERRFMEIARRVSLSKVSRASFGIKVRGPSLIHNKRTSTILDVSKWRQKREETEEADPETMPESLKLTQKRSKKNKFFSSYKNKKSHMIDDFVQSQLNRDYQDSVDSLKKPIKSEYPFKLKKDEKPVFLKFDQTAKDLRSYCSTYNEEVLREQRAREGIVNLYKKHHQLFKLFPPSIEQSLYQEEEKEKKQIKLQQEMLRDLTWDRDRKQLLKEVYKDCFRFCRTVGMLNPIWNFIALADCDDEPVSQQSRNIKMLIEKGKIEKISVKKVMESLAKYLAIERGKEDQEGAGGAIKVVDLTKIRSGSQPVVRKGKNGQKKEFRDFEILSDYSNCLNSEELEKDKDVFESIKKSRKVIRSTEGIAYKLEKYSEMMNEQIKKMVSNRVNQSSILEECGVSRFTKAKLLAAIESSRYYEVERILEKWPKLARYKDCVSSILGGYFRFIEY